MMLAGIIAALALLCADQALKAWTVSAFSAPLSGATTTPDPARPLLPGILELTRVHNTGAAWSSFAGMRWLLVAVTTVLMLALLVLLCRKIVRHPLGVWAIFLLLSGGVGNLIDRVRLGYVVDMLNFQFIRFPVFNLADVCVVCGTVLGVIYYLWFYQHDEKKKELPHGDHPSADPS